jgi:hypothetical protein
MLLTAGLVDPQAKPLLHSDVIIASLPSASLMGPQGLWAAELLTFRRDHIQTGWGILNTEAGDHNSQTTFERL